MSNPETITEAKLRGIPKRSAALRAAATSPFRLLRIYLAALALCGMPFVVQARASNAPGEPDTATTTPSQLYNDGTKQLSNGKLQEAEACLQGAVASQNTRVQGPALYNLGETRFRQGTAELKKGPDSKRVTDSSHQASQDADEAIKSADKALAGDDVSALVEAYQRGRGARKELKSAMAAVKSAMQTYGAVLSKWQRSSGDFKSDLELAPSDMDAKTNADRVDQNIAKLVDMQQMMMQMMNGMGKQREELQKKLGQMKKKMPGGDQDQQAKGGGDDEDDDDENGKKPDQIKEGTQEPGPKNGKEMMLSYEEAARLLDMLKLDSNRKLPLGDSTNAPPKDHKGRDW